MGELVGAFAAHLVGRHGLEEIAGGSRVERDVGHDSATGTSGRSRQPHIALYNASHRAIMWSARASVGGVATEEFFDVAEFIVAAEV